MQNFNTMGLPDAILASLKALQFDTPTPIQAAAIPPALEGKDVLGSAQTGTGKTLAYLLPIVARLISRPSGSALVLAPTRELALQVQTAFKQFVGHKSTLYSTLLIGGDSLFKQLKQLRSKPRFIVGTPGRINDHLQRGSLRLEDADFLVLDEMDRMLDMGFAIQIQEIIKRMPKQRQTLMFSATMPPSILKSAEQYLKDAVRVSVGSTRLPIETIKQEVIRISESQKFGALTEQLDKREGSVIIFVKTKFGTERLADKLNEAGHEADAIHGDLKQRVREKVIQAFRKKEHRILVATDVASRGLDIPHIECVVNYDLPQCPEDYIHRIGRTGRAGAEGVAISLVTSQDGGKWKDICRLMNPNEKQPEHFQRPPSRQSKGGGSGPFAGFKKREGDFSYKRDGSSFGHKREGREFLPKRDKGGFSPRRDSSAVFSKKRNEFSPKRSEFAPKRRSDFAPKREKSDFTAKKRVYTPKKMMPGFKDI